MRKETLVRSIPVTSFTRLWYDWNWWYLLVVFRIKSSPPKSNKMTATVYRFLLADCVRLTTWFLFEAWEKESESQKEMARTISSQNYHSAQTFCHRENLSLGVKRQAKIKSLQNLTTAVRVVFSRIASEGNKQRSGAIISRFFFFNFCPSTLGNI